MAPSRPDAAMLKTHPASFGPCLQRPRTHRRCCFAGAAELARPSEDGAAAAAGHIPPFNPQLLISKGGTVNVSPDPLLGVDSGGADTEDSFLEELLGGSPGYGGASYQGRHGRSSTAQHSLQDTSASVLWPDTSLGSLVHNTTVSLSVTTGAESDTPTITLPITLHPPQLLSSVTHLRNDQVRQQHSNAGQEVKAASRVVDHSVQEQQHKLHDQDTASQLCNDVEREQKAGGHTMNQHQHVQQHNRHAHAPASHQQHSKSTAGQEVKARNHSDSNQQQQQRQTQGQDNQHAEQHAQPGQPNQSPSNLLPHKQHYKQVEQQHKQQGKQHAQPAQQAHALHQAPSAAPPHHQPHQQQLAQGLGRRPPLIVKTAQPQPTTTAPLHQPRVSSAGPPPTSPAITTDVTQANPGGAELQPHSNSGGSESQPNRSGVSEFQDLVNSLMAGLTHSPLQPRQLGQSSAQAEDEATGVTQGVRGFTASIPGTRPNNRGAGAQPKVVQLQLGSLTRLVTGHSSHTSGHTSQSDTGSTWPGASAVQNSFNWQLSTPAGRWASKQLVKALQTARTHAEVHDLIWGAVLSANSDQQPTAAAQPAAHPHISAATQQDGTGATSHRQGPCQQQRHEEQRQGPAQAASTVQRQGVPAHSKGVGRAGHAAHPGRLQPWQREGVQVNHVHVAVAMARYAALTNCPDTRSGRLAPDQEGPLMSLLVAVLTQPPGISSQQGTARQGLPQPQGLLQQGPTQPQQRQSGTGSIRAPLLSPSSSSSAPATTPEVSAPPLSAPLWLLSPTGLHSVLWACKTLDLWDASLLMGCEQHLLRHAASLPPHHLVHCASALTRLWWQPVKKTSNLYLPSSATPSASPAAAAPSAANGSNGANAAGSGFTATSSRTTTSSSNSSDIRTLVLRQLARAARRPGGLRELPEASLVHLLWCFAQAGHTDHELLDAMQSELRYPRLNRFTPSQLALALHCYSQLIPRPSRSLTSRLLSHIAPRAHLLSPASFLQLYSALAKWRVPVPPRLLALPNSRKGRARQLRSSLSSTLDPVTGSSATGGAGNTRSTSAGAAGGMSSAGTAISGITQRVLVKVSSGRGLPPSRWAAVAVSHTSRGAGANHTGRGTGASHTSGTGGSGFNSSTLGGGNTTGALVLRGMNPRRRRMRVARWTHGARISTAAGALAVQREWVPQAALARIERALVAMLTAANSSTGHRGRGGDHLCASTEMTAANSSRGQQGLPVPGPYEHQQDLPSSATGKPSSSSTGKHHGSGGGGGGCNLHASSEPGGVRHQAQHSPMQQQRPHGGSQGLRMGKDHASVTGEVVTGILCSMARIPCYSPFRVTRAALQAALARQLLSCKRSHAMRALHALVLLGANSRDVLHHVVHSWGLGLINRVPGKEAASTAFNLGRQGQQGKQGKEQEERGQNKLQQKQQVLAHHQALQLQQSSSPSPVHHHHPSTQKQQQLQQQVQSSGTLVQHKASTPLHQHGHSPLQTTPQLLSWDQIHLLAEVWHFCSGSAGRTQVLGPPPPAPSNAGVTAPGTGAAVSGRPAPPVAVLQVPGKAASPFPPHVQLPGSGALGPARPAHTPGPAPNTIPAPPPARTSAAAKAVPRHAALLAQPQVAGTGAAVSPPQVPSNAAPSAPASAPAHAVAGKHPPPPQQPSQGDWAVTSWVPFINLHVLPQLVQVQPGTAHKHYQQANGSSAASSADRAAVVTKVIPANTSSDTTEPSPHLLATLVHTSARLGCRHEALIRIACARLERQIACLTPVTLRHLLWSLGRLRVAPEGLVVKIARRSKDMLTQAVSAVGKSQQQQRQLHQQQRLYKRGNRGGAEAQPQAGGRVTRVTIKSFRQNGNGRSGGEGKQGQGQQGSTNRAVTDNVGVRHNPSTHRPAAARSQQPLSSHEQQMAEKEAAAAQQAALVSALIISSRLVWVLARAGQAPDSSLVSLLCGTLCTAPNVLPAPEWPRLLWALQAAGALPDGILSFVGDTLAAHIREGRLGPSGHVQVVAVYAAARTHHEGLLAVSADLLRRATALQADTRAARSSDGLPQQQQKQQLMSAAAAYAALSEHRGSAASLARLIAASPHSGEVLREAHRVLGVQSHL